MLEKATLIQYEFSVNVTYLVASKQILRKLG